MTKKEIQTLENWEVVQAVKTMQATLPHCDEANKHRLRSCSATVWDMVDRDTGVVEYTILRSYNTTVAFYNHTDRKVYDILRMVYTYTPTSASHIAKFAHDCHAIDKLTYKEV